MTDPFQEKERIAKAVANLAVELELLGYDATAKLTPKGGEVLWRKRRERSRPNGEGKETMCQNQD